MNLSLSEIFPNPDQPRKAFDSGALNELADSIRENGLLEPIVVTPRGEKYMIIAGERRFRACHIAGVTSPPVRIIHADDKTVAELALLENLQRRDLNPIEEALAYQRLMDEFGMSEKELAQKMGINQPWRIKDKTILLNLCPDYRRRLIDKHITPTQAWELARLPEEKQHILYEKISQGKANSITKLRAIANAILVPPPTQAVFFGKLSEKEKSIGNKYDALVDRLLSFIRRSFNQEDLTVLKAVTRSTVSANIEKLNLIIQDLNRIKKAMEEAEGRKESIAA